ncbi:MAG: CHAT domain-containing protein [Okeania sp.]|nr:CHAT domain-containing protein [Okeania sp.]
MGGYPTALAQSSPGPIVPEPNSTNTVVTPVKPSNNSDPTRFDITGGKRSRDNTNIFHSFSEFSLTESQIVNFISNPNIENILTRVTGGDASVINGLIQVTGGNSNLFIMNPAGIIFGANARLDVPGSFVVTTGSSIDFNSGSFNSTGKNNYNILTGNPAAFSFPINNLGVIINEGELTVEPGKSVVLLGGTIINTGKISAPGGEITISTILGEDLVRISQEGRLLNLEIKREDGESSSTNLSEELETLHPLSIPQLLTGNNEAMETATGVTVNGDNQVVLTGSNQVIPTDSGTTIISGYLDVSGTEDSELSNTSGINIFGEKVGLFDANLDASSINGSGNIRIGGDFSDLRNVPNATRIYVDEGTEISAKSSFSDGGNIVISSAEETTFFGKIEATGYIEKPSNSVELNSTKNRVEISSQGILIFDGTVNLGSANTLGDLSFKAENIKIVHSNIQLEDNSLTEQKATESQISQSSIETISNANIKIEAADNITINDLSEAELNLINTIGEISFIADSDQNGSGYFIIDSKNTINTQGAEINISGTTINTGNINTNGGELNLTSSQGFIMTNNLSTANLNIKLERNGGDINIDAQRNITTGEIDSSGKSRGGNITINSAASINTQNIISEGQQSGGNIEIASENTLNLQGISTSSDSTTTGNIFVSAREVNFLGGENSISSNGKLTIQSTSENNNITLGGFENTQALNLTTLELTALANGFSSINIGKSENSGTITIYSPENGDRNGVIFDDPVTIQAERITGKGTISGRDNANITLNAKGDISTGDISASGDINIRSNEGNIEIGNVNANTSNKIIGNIDIFSDDGSIKTGKLTTTRTTTTSEISGRDDANITLNANRDISTDDISVSGDINIRSNEGSIETGKLTTTRITRGGNIDIEAGDRLTTKEINSSAKSGKGGDVTLSAENDIEIFSIKAEGGNFGGDVEISTDDTLRITGAFSNQNQNLASISTAGESAGGNIVISTEKEFTVGNAATNGSVQTITNGEFTISPKHSLSRNFDLLDLKEIENSQSELQETSTKNRENESSVNTNEEVQKEQIVPPETNRNSPVLGSSEMTTSARENVDNLQVSEEEVPALMVEEQTTEELEPTNPSRLLWKNPEETILVQDTNSEGTIILEDTNSNINSSVFEVSEPTIATENFAEGKFSEEPTSNIVIEENMTITASEISAKDNFPIRLTDTISQIELTRGKEFASYLGENISRRTATPANIRDTLSSVAKIGIKPAIIYVSARSNYLELQLFLPNGKPVVKSLRKSREEVIEVAKKFTNQIRNPSQLDSRNYLENSQILYQWLIEPIYGELRNNHINMIIFSMDSGLRTLPIAALYDNERKQYLVEKYSLALIPSFSLTDTRYTGLKGSQILAMGASEFPTDANQTPLPAVPIELNAIVNKYWSGKSFLNQQFTLKNLLQQRSKEKFKIIHLATHGEFHPGGADNSYIQFWDTKLRLNEFRQLRLYSPQVELLVLSACTTAVGDEDAELGFAGLAVQAGVKSALASLWYVSDTGTLALMTEFYENLSKRPIKAEALREAQLAMLRGEVQLEDGLILRNGNPLLSLPRQLVGGDQKDLSHPYYWAGFTMIGSPW